MLRTDHAASAAGAGLPDAPWRFHGLVVAYGVSVYGNFLSLIALSLFSYQVTGSALGLGLLMALRLSAGVAAGAAGGALAARYDRRTLMISTDLAQAAAMLALAAAGDGAAVPLVAAVVVVLGSGNALFNVALRTAVPVMTGQAGRVRANGRLVTARSLATVLGFGSAAPVIALGGYPAAFAVNAVSFLVSAGALALLRPRTNPTAAERAAEDAAGAGRGGDHGPAADGGGDGRRARRGAGRAGRLGLGAVRYATPLLAAMVALRGVDAFASSSHNVGLPVAAELADPARPAVFMAQFWASWAVGSLLAHQLVKRLTARPGGEALLGERGFALGTCLMSVAFVAAFTGLPGPALVAVALVAGLADGYTDIAYTSRLQAEPDRVRSRLFGLTVTAETSGFALGMLGAAVALEALPVPAVVGAFHGVALVTAAAFWLLLPGLRARSAVPAPAAAPAVTRTARSAGGAGGGTAAPHVHGDTEESSHDTHTA